MGITARRISSALRYGQPANEVGAQTDMNQALDLMAGRVLAYGDAVTIGVGDGGAPTWGDALFHAAREADHEAFVFRYRVPPSIGAHTGPTVGLVVSKTRLSAAARAALTTSNDEISRQVGEDLA